MAENSDGHAGGTPDPDAALPATRVLELAAQYLARVDRGEARDADEEADAITDVILREQFRRLIGDAMSVQDLLPVQVRPGMVLSDRYRVGREIGSGGMGRVFEAFDRQLERMVALKVLSLPAATSFDAKSQFRREAILLAALHHPNIVAVHEIAAAGDVHYIVMDLVRGTPLDAVIAKARELNALQPPGLQGVAPLRRALAPAGSSAPSAVPDADGPASEATWARAVARVVKEASQTIEAAHAAGVVHRDIKPKNVMLRADGSPVLLDFGLAGLLEEEQVDLSQGLFGTTGYLAPEQVRRGRVGNDPRSDVYQLGVLLHELLTLSRAFDGDDHATLLKRISAGQLAAPQSPAPAVPGDLADICRRAMDVDPERRYPTARALREDLERFLSGLELPLAASAEGVSRLVRRGRYAVRRHRVWAIGGAALLAGAMLGAVAWVRSVVPPDEITAFRYRPEANETVLDSDITSVRAGDELGVVIRTQEPLYVYAVSIFGQRDPPTWVAPMWLKAVPGPTTGSPEGLPTETRQGLRIPAGTTQVVCTVIGPYDSDNPYEGLWVFTSREPSESLEGWLATMDDQASESEHKAIPFAAARLAYGSTGDGVRGGSPPERSPQQARAMSDSLTAAMLLGESEWPFEDPRRWSQVWPVEP